jgi:polysaccharide biosynthesis/export protein
MRSKSNYVSKLAALVALSLSFMGAIAAQESTPAVPSGQIASPAVVTAASPSGSIPGPSTSPLTPGDVIDIAVFGVPEMTQRVRLNTTGSVYLPLLNEVQLSGLTPEAAQKKLDQALLDGGFLRSPHVSVTVTEYAHGISILGEVARPGVYPSGGARHLYDVLAAAGGLTQNAGSLVTISHSEHPDTSEAVNISRDPSKAPEANVLISPGDTVVVSKAGVVYVVGEVLNPAGFIMDSDQPMTVLKLVAMAHGANRTAKLNGTKLIRKSDKGFVEIPVPLGDIMRAKVKDVEVRPDDIVFVPNSVAKGAAKRTLDVALGMITSLSVIHATN